MTEVFAEPVTGHRSWSLDTVQMNLVSAFGPWLTGFMEAECRRFHHESPHWPEPLPDRGGDWLVGLPPFTDRDRCMCGINAYKLYQPLDPYRTRDDDGNPVTQVVGIVDLGGRVHEYEHGYRAQYGRLAEATIISRVRYGSRFTTYLADKYEAPFRVMTWSDYYHEWEITHGRDWEAEAEDNDAEAGAETQTGTQTGAGQRTRTGGLTSSTSSIQVAMQANTTAIQKHLLSAWSRLSSDPTPSVTAEWVGNRWQPALSDGRRLYRYLSLQPEWVNPDYLFSSHRPVLHRSRKAAERKGRAVQEGKWWARQTFLTLAPVLLPVGVFVFLFAIFLLEVHP